MKPMPGEITAVAQLPDTDGDWHLIAQVAGLEGGPPTHGTLHAFHDQQAGTAQVRIRPVEVDAQIVNAVAIAQQEATRA